MLKFQFEFYRDGEWFRIPQDVVSENGFSYESDGACYSASFSGSTPLSYTLTMKAPFRTKLKMEIQLEGETELFHLIPCNIYGNNNLEKILPGEYPVLTDLHPETPFCSPYWEFRADRACLPVSILCCSRGAAGVSIDPYSETGDRIVRNGVFAALPNRFGVTLGYTNLPVTAKNKRTPERSIGDSAFEAQASGTIYWMEGAGRLDAHRIIREEYEKRHVRASYQKSLQEAARGLFETFLHVNWDNQEKEYTNRSCRVPDNTKLRPWRIVPEIGWTGGGVLAYPLVLCRWLLDEVSDETFGDALPGEGILERIIDSYHEESGLFYDLTRPAQDGSRVNGWWTGYGLVKDCHCAYTVASGLYYVLKTVMFLKKQGIAYPQRWTEVSRRVMDTAIRLQREDGAFGYTYSTTRPEVLDWDGFAGCWFAPCAVYFYRLTGESTYLEAARKALRYYGKQVKALNCWGTPMDTWKSVDQEGNIAFVHGCRLLHESTGEQEFLELLQNGAEYEYLWRYGFQTNPDYRPLNSGWVACGGSVTSVSNPHIHPMGVLIDEDLRYLAEVTGDSYHQSRAEDSFAWLMQTLELYPEKTGYGQYGVLSERWCPSDGLTIESYSDGEKYSSWFSYNLWAAANALEAVCERILHG